MGFVRRLVAGACAAGALASLSSPFAAAQAPSSLDPALFAEMAWRSVGPVRADGTPASFHHVSTDSSFPYRICGADRAGFAACVSSRGDRHGDSLLGWKGARDVALPDPSDPDVLFGGRVTRYDRRSGQTQHVQPLGDAETTSAPAPLAFSPIEPRALFYGSDVLWKTVNGGQTWASLSPPPGRAISAMAPSPLDPRVVWTGTADGAISVTRDSGQSWVEAAPPDGAGAGAVSALEASHFDVGTAYASFDEARGGGRQPALFRTRSAGRTWTPITAGLPEGSAVHAVREDGLRRGLLFAATDTGVHVSFDDGDRWQSLALNLPPAPVRSLAIKHDDLVVAVDGAGFWVLDDIMALRQLTPDVARAPLYLFRPAIGWRSALPGHGVVLSYLLGPAFSGTVTLEVRDAITETVLRRFSSGDADATIPETPGLHRVVWDARLAPPRGAPRGTPGAMVLPGTYQVRLTSGERVQRQAVVVRPDPRARASVADLTLQFRLSTSLHDAMRNLDDARHVLTERHAMLAGAGGRVPAAAAALDRAGRPLLGLFLEIQQADARPTDAQQTAIDEALQGAESALAMFRELVTP